jgi:two-component system response regulator RegA
MSQGGGASGGGGEGASLLIVDDDETFRRRLAKALAERGFEVRVAGDSAAALAEASRGEAPEAAVIDLRMPGPSGLEVVRALKELEPAMRILVLTGYGSIATAVEAMKLGASNYLTKPADADEIVRALFDQKPGAAGSSTPSLARAEWEHIQRVLADCDGNISEAARRLGLHRRSLQRKLAKYPPNN